MRIKNTIKNAVVGTSMQLFSMIFSFVTRAVFARVLTVEYLGIESIFADIINMLSIAELGFGTAITYSLYQPIKNNDHIKINSIMKLYKRVYETIGLLIFIGGLLITPFIPIVINNIPSVSENIYFIFILFLLNSVISYFFAYKQTLIIANQKDYVVQVVTKSFTIVSNLIQIVSLIIFKDFVLYYIIKIITVFIINIYLSKKADSLYPYLNLANAQRLDKKELKKIKQNIGAMFMHKVGYRIVFSTDNIFISLFSNVANAGRYSNYNLITSSLALLLDMVLNASTASVGNLNVENDKIKSETIFQHIFFLNFLLYSFSSSILLMILNDFILIWIGPEYQLNLLACFLIVLNFFIHGMRRTVIIFRDSWGLFYRDRFKPVLEIVINIVLQLILGHLWGLNGILLGTSLSILFSSFWIEPLVLYKYGFETKVSHYFFRYFRYSMKMVVFVTISNYLMNFIQVEGMIELVFKVILGAVTTLVFMVALLINEKSFKYYISLLRILLYRNDKGDKHAD